MKMVAAALAAILLSSGTGLAQSGQILTISGEIEESNRGPSGEGMFKAHDIAFEQALALSLEDLVALPQTTYDETPPNDHPDAQYSGPMLADVLQLAGATGSEFQLTGLDGYVVELDRASVDQYAPILAISAVGASLGIGDYGPVKIVFPPTDDEELRKTHNSMSVWALYHIGVE